MFIKYTKPTTIKTAFRFLPLRYYSARTWRREHGNKKAFVEILIHNFTCDRNRMHVIKTYLLKKVYIKDFVVVVAVRPAGTLWQLRLLPSGPTHHQLRCDIQLHTHTHTHTNTLKCQYIERHFKAKYPIWRCVFFSHLLQQFKKIKMERTAVQFLSASYQCIHIESVWLVCVFVSKLKSNSYLLHLLARTTTKRFIEVLISMLCSVPQNWQLLLLFLWEWGGGGSILKCILKLNCPHRM